MNSSERFPMGPGTTHRNGSRFPPFREPEPPELLRERVCVGYWELFTPIRPRLRHCRPSCMRHAAPTLLFNEACHA